MQRDDGLHTSHVSTSLTQSVWPTVINFPRMFVLEKASFKVYVFIWRIFLFREKTRAWSILSFSYGEYRERFAIVINSPYYSNKYRTWKSHIVNLIDKLFWHICECTFINMCIHTKNHLKTERFRWNLNYLCVSMPWCKHDHSSTQYLEWNLFLYVFLSVRLYDNSKTHRSSWVKFSNVFVCVWIQ